MAQIAKLKTYYFIVSINNKIIIFFILYSSNIFLTKDKCIMRNKKEENNKWRTRSCSM